MKFFIYIDYIGTIYYYVDSKLHRDNGPAIEYSHGEKHWYKNGKRHREDGPAIESACGHKYWYLENKPLTKEALLKQLKLKLRVMENM